ncbi:MAG: hypothetical protein ACYDEB_14545 [Dehalococcoidia bacterium]
MDLADEAFRAHIENLRIMAPVLRRAMEHRAFVEHMLPPPALAAFGAAATAELSKMHASMAETLRAYERVSALGAAMAETIAKTDAAMSAMRWDMVLSPPPSAAYPVAAPQAECRDCLEKNVRIAKLEARIRERRMRDAFDGKWTRPWEPGDSDLSAN